MVSDREGEQKAQSYGGFQDFGGMYRSCGVSDASLGALFTEDASISIKAICNSIHNYTITVHSATWYVLYRVSHDPPPP